MSQTMPIRLQMLARIAALAVCAAAAAACEVNLNTEGVTSKETRTFAVSGKPDLTLETFDGAIEIHSWDRNEVEVEIEKRAMEQGLLDQMSVEAEQDGDRIVLRVKGPGRRDSGGLHIGVHISPTARLRVAVPRNLLLQARTEDGSIRVENLEGRLALRTGDGSVTADRLSGDVEVRTGDGAIRIEKGDGKFDLETDDGSITVDARPSMLKAKTGDGSIRVQVEPESVMSDAWDLSTGDGSVTLTLPATFNADIDAETRDGAVRSSHPALKVVEHEGEGRRESRRELKTRMGEGGPLLRVRTSDGTIRFES
jgi:hypothetical protein